MTQLTLGSRVSKLAMWQTRRVIGLLEAARPGLKCGIRTFETEGDKRLDKPLPEIGGKGLFTLELEEALRNKDIDAAVHSLKDIPVADSPGLTLGAITSRAEAHDCLVARGGLTLAELPKGAVVGTSSVRRRAQLLAVRPDLAVESIRGNVETRIGKVMDGQYDAAVLAGAGVERLGLTEHISERFPFETMLPAPGQGALAVQCRADDEETLALLSRIEDPAARSAVTAERSFLEALGGGCSAPVGAYATTARSRAPWNLTMRTVVASIDGTRLVRLVHAGDDPRQLGLEMARVSIQKGAGEILAQAEAGAAGDKPSADRRPAARPLAGKRPLEGKRIVVTRAHEQSRDFCEKLAGLGADIVPVPVIRFVPVEDRRGIDAAISSMSDYDWVVFTSQNGVEMLWYYLEGGGKDAPAGKDASLFDGVRVAAVGTATARSLTDRGVSPDFVPEVFVGENIADGLGDVAGKRICLLRAQDARKNLPDALTRRGANVEDVAVYRTLPAEIDPARLVEVEKGVDAVTVTSGSTVRYFAAALRAHARTAPLLKKMSFICIGPVTADAARDLELEVAAVAGVHTADGLLEALVEYFKQE